jgi:DNA invertase Pin-like site-specific DNA recombinase
MRFGYARVSTTDQELAAQIDALEAAGCDEILQEKVSSRAALRPELERLLDKARSGDQIVIYRLDRLGRSLSHLINLVEQFNQQGIELISLKENIDTSHANGKLTFHLFATLAQFERDLISERTKSGLAAARARGRVGGRPASLTKDQIAIAKAALSDPNVQVTNVAKQLGVSRSTLYRYLK